MKIAYFTDTYAPELNGVTNTLTKLGNYLKQREIRHSFFVPAYDNKTAEGPNAAQDIQSVYRFPGIRVAISPNGCFPLPRTREIFGLCDAFAPDLVHVINEGGLGNQGRKYALARRLPLVMSFHTDYTNYLSYHHLEPIRPVADLYLKWFYACSQKTLVPSAHTMRQLADKGFGNLGIWSRGIDTERFNRSFRSLELRESLGIRDRFAFSYIGRLSAEKGLHMFLPAIKKINALFPGKAVFVFTGDGPYAETIRKWNFDNVVMTGFKTGAALSRVYASCDCYAFPSGTETFGNSALEAVASGLPVVGVNRGGVTEFLVHNGNALLCADGDREAFANNLIRVMQDPRLRAALAENGRLTALSRDWNAIFDGLLKEYQDVLEARSGKRLVRVS